MIVKYVKKNLDIMKPRYNVIMNKFCQSLGPLLYQGSTLLCFENLPPSDRQLNLFELHSLDEGHLVGLGME